MIKLFRNTRRKLLSENKFTKYITYAIGEIFLVVVGILIAVWINSKNQERINEARAVTILKEIQKDLKKDIKVAEVTVNRIITTDSIAKLLLWDKITGDEMFAIHEKNSYGIVFRDITFTSSDNGYVNYKRNLNNIPAKYSSISNDLKFLYGTIRVDGEARNERIRSTALENLDKINRYDWVVEAEKGFMSEEAKNYFIRDLEFKKILLKYMNGIANVFILTQAYEQKAIDVHNKISKLLNSEDYIPSYPSFRSSIDSLQQNNLNGKYKLKETMSPSFFKEIIELKEVDNKLHVYAREWPEYQFYSNDKNTFLKTIDPQDLVLTYIKLTQSENIGFFVAAGKSRYAYYTKIDD